MRFFIKTLLVLIVLQVYAYIYTNYMSNGIHIALNVVALFALEYLFKSLE